MAERMPAMIGPRILSRVQIAATPIVPAPTKRTLLRTRRRRNRPSSSRPGCGGERRVVRHEKAQLIISADEHGDANRQADEMANADQQHRQAARSRGRARCRP